jgi:hypothetical protein
MVFDEDDSNAGDQTRGALAKAALVDFHHQISGFRFLKR